jgi:Urocanase Rossmann-like domain
VSLALFSAPIPTDALPFTLQVERLFDGLMRAARSPWGKEREPHAEPGLTETNLGGKLIYASELNADVRALLVAANIAGAASLTATADAARYKQAIRDGVADFAVNSLDEALRILKNEIRKREPVAVAIGASPLDVEREMIERGVLPDLVAAIAPPRGEDFDAAWEDIPRIELTDAQNKRNWISWCVSSAPRQWLPKLDAMAMDLVGNGEGQAEVAARRWLRLAPRYLGRLAEGVRVLRCEPGMAIEFMDRVRSGVERGEIGVAVEVSVKDGKEICRFSLDRGQTSR